MECFWCLIKAKLFDIGRDVVQQFYFLFNFFSGICRVLKCPNRDTQYLPLESIEMDTKPIKPRIIGYYEAFYSFSISTPKTN